MTSYTKQELINRLDKSISDMQAKRREYPEYADAYNQAIRDMYRHRTRIVESDQKVYIFPPFKPTQE